MWKLAVEAQMYTGLMDSARAAGAKLQDVVQKVAWAPPKFFLGPSPYRAQTQGAAGETGAPSRVSPSVVKKIRDIGPRGSVNGTLNHRVP